MDAVSTARDFFLCFVRVMAVLDLREGKAGLTVVVGEDGTASQGEVRGSELGRGGRPVIQISSFSQVV